MGNYDYYAVKKGKNPGVYRTWAECQRQVKGFPGARHKGFHDYKQAMRYVGPQRSHQCSPSGCTPRPSTPRDYTAHDVVSSITPALNNPLDASRSYFAQVPNFQPDEAVSFDDEFYRLTSSQQIPHGSQIYTRHRTIAIRHELFFLYSQRSSVQNFEDKKLHVYQEMCRQVGAKPLDTLRGCALTLKSTLVDVVDYIDVRRDTARQMEVYRPEQFDEFAEDARWSQPLDMNEAVKWGGFLSEILPQCYDRQLFERSRKDVEKARIDFERRCLDREMVQLKALMRQKLLQQRAQQSPVVKQGAPGLRGTNNHTEEEDRARYQVNSNRSPSDGELSRPADQEYGIKQEDEVRDVNVTIINCPPFEEEAPQPTNKDDGIKQDVKTNGRMKEIQIHIKPATDEQRRYEMISIPSDSEPGSLSPPGGLVSSSGTEDKPSSPKLLQKRKRRAEGQEGQSLAIPMSERTLKKANTSAKAKPAAKTSILDFFKRE